MSSCKIPIFVHSQSNEERSPRKSVPRAISSSRRQNLKGPLMDFLHNIEYTISKCSIQAKNDLSLVLPFDVQNDLIAISTYQRTEWEMVWDKGPRFGWVEIEREETFEKVNSIRNNYNDHPSSCICGQSTLLMN
jgi:hypothetical protein